jgi:hypothetical protein
MTNVSNKTILLVVLVFSVTPLYGPEQPYTMNMDYFFAPNIIKPGDTRDFSTTPTAEGFTNETPYDPNKGGSLREPHAEVRVAFAQFSDGTAFGMETYADQVLKDRAMTLERLRFLDKTYSYEGEAEFTTALNKPVSSSRVVNQNFKNIQSIQKVQGTQAATDEVRAMLARASEREAAFTNH